MGLAQSRPDPSQLLNSKEAREINQLISENAVIVFSKSYCPYCQEVKDIFKKMSVPYHSIELDVRHDGQELQDILQYMTKTRTVPRVFVNGECIGGASETKALFKNGQLQSKLGSMES